MVKSSLLTQLSDIKSAMSDEATGQLLLQAQQLAAMNKPPMRDQMSLRFFVENRRCLVKEESSFAYETEDLITLRPGRDHSFVDAFVERLLKTFHCKPLQVRIFFRHSNIDKRIC